MMASGNVNPVVWWNCRHEPVSITCMMRVQFVLWLLENRKRDLSCIPVNKGTNHLGGQTTVIRMKIVPLQLAIHVAQNRHAGEQKSQWDKTNKGNYHLKLCTSFICSVPVRLLLSIMEHGGFLPREWLTTKGLLFTRGASISFLYVCLLEWNAGKVYSQSFSSDDGASYM